MTLHSLVLHGFKSFPDRTRINFLHPVSAIVGPNGCGKSNIVDALRWVLGESSFTSVRGTKMADVIFSGSHSRTARPQASVELLLHNTDQMFSGAFAQYQEISVSRHIFTDGKSNYQINGSRVKKRDIVDLFAGTGLGHNSYSIIEQGMVSQLVTSKPAELKGYIEEVAGVSQFHARKHETQNRLERTRKNLVRLQDLVRTFELQEKHLRQQVATAAEYSRIKEEMARLDYIVTAQDYKQITDNLTRAQKRYDQYDALHQTSITAQADIELRISEQYTLLSDYQTRIDQAVKKEQEVTFAVQMLDEKITWHKNEQYRVQKEQMRLSAKNTATQQAKVDIEQQITALEQQLRDTSNADESEWRILETDIANASQEYEYWQQKTNKQLQLYKDQAAAYERAQETYHRTKKECEQLEAQHTQTNAQEQRDAIITRLHAAQSEQAELTLRAQVIERQNARLHSIITTHTHKQQTQNSLVTKSEQAQQNIRNEQQVVAQLLLAKGSQHNATTLDGTLLQAHVAIDADWTSAFDALFAEHWYYFLDANNTNPQAVAHWYTASTHTHTHQVHQALRPLATCVTNNFPLPSFCALGFVLQDETQLLAARETLVAGEWILLHCGDIVGHDWYKKAPSQNDGLVKLTAKKDQIKQQLHAHTDAHKQLTKLLALYTQQAARLQRILAHYAQQTRDIETVQATVSRRLYEEEIALANHAKTTQHASWLAEQIKQKQTQCAELEQICHTTQDSQTTYDQYKHTIATESAQQAEIIRCKNEHYQASKLAWHRQQDAHKNAQRQRTLLCERQQELHAREQDDQQQAASLADYKSIDVSELTAQLAERTTEQQLTVAQTHNFREQHAIARDTMNRLKSELTHATEQERTHDINKNKQKALIESIEPQLATHAALLTERNITPATALSVAEDAANDKIDHKKHYTQAQIALEKIGAVNLLAEQEHATCSARLHEMNNQHDEIMQAITNLEQAIDNIDQEAQKRLSDIVNRINDQLVLICDSMFKGGHCSLRPTDDNAGIEIHTQLPGKKQFSLKLLSGGERALVATAFIFALFSLNPAPFCVFDEVDAPLDDANATALADMIAAYKDRVQFIIVTHNKIMMSKADDLLGITMSESGVSRFVPVNIEQALAWKTA